MKYGTEKLKWKDDWLSGNIKDDPLIYSGYFIVYK